MRILYGVVGEGMGHATRSRVSLDHLLAGGHEVRVVVSGRAHTFLTDRFKDRRNIRFDEIHGLHMNYEGNAVDKSESVRTNLEDAPRGLLQNVEVYRKVAEDGFKPDVVFSDFESWAYLYGLNHRIPVVSIDNMQVLNRCRHDDDVTHHRGFHFRLAKAAVKLKLPGAYHYLVTSFFFPEVRKPRTTLVPPILRAEILAARREPGAHVLVYQTAAANTDLVPTLRKLPFPFRVYGLGRAGTEGNVTLCAFSETGFVEDLRTARAVVAGGGYSLMGEAVHLHVPMMSIPLEGQYEQELNARYLQKLGYGVFARALDVDVMARFLADTDRHAHALQQYRPADNSMLLAAEDELLQRVQRGQSAPVRLASPSLGSYGGKAGADGDDVH
ncbi:MAG: teichoic acid biosynthesis protein [Deltaproteobacteria bacterium]|nr:teichoic acid biosynthesis protein [Deltaproteobacteria bacterium]